MPYCIVPGCDNYRKQKREGINASYHRLPADAERCREWLRVIKNPKFADDTPASVLASLRVCSLHFTADDYNRNMRSELFGGPAKRSLKTSAVPTLFGGDAGQGEVEPRREQRSRVEASGGSVCSVLPTVRHVASQTESPETKPETRPQTRTVGTQLSIKTLQNAFRSTATQVRVPSRDCGVCTLTFPLDSPILFLQPTVAKRPSKRPRLCLKEEEEGPSESSLSVVAHEPENST